MIRLVSAMLALAMLAGCATPMYRAPDVRHAAVLKIDNQLGQNAGAGGGWMASASGAARAGIFTIDGERLDEQGGEESTTLRPGKHEIQIFADSAGILRFGTFVMQAVQGEEYVVRVRKGDTTSYQAEVVNAARPDVIMQEVDF